MPLRRLFLFIASGLCALLLFLPTLSMAHAIGDEPPDMMLQRITEEMITAMRQSDRALREDPNQINTIINKILDPYLDWDAMSRWVVGRNYWEKASQSERQRFTKAFRDLLIRTYATTLRAYNNQTVTYLPIRESSEGKTRVQVSSLISESGREPINVTYRLSKEGDHWKIYDISIEGVSLLKGFESQFAQEIQQNGLDALSARLEQHNDKPR